MQLLILKTNIDTIHQVRSIAPIFNRHPLIVDWSVDTEDVDKVLRIEATSDITNKNIQSLIKPYGLLCEDLPD